MKGYMALDCRMLERYGVPVVGVDEVGVGPWAGPMVACALTVTKEDAETIRDGALEVRDSKQLTERHRDQLFPRIIAVSKYGLGWVSAPEIEAIHNLTKAGDLARERAVTELMGKLVFRPSVIISDWFEMKIDGIPNYHCAKADSKSFAVAAASIVAKVTHDGFMREAHRQYPDYDWDHNKGYGTPRHQQAIKIHGLTSLHRKYITEAGMKMKKGWAGLGEKHQKRNKPAEMPR
jgi:ribonuclease HII